jgi:retron-type reverse transcriptase
VASRAKLAEAQGKLDEIQNIACQIYDQESFLHTSANRVAANKILKVFGVERKTLYITR